MTFRSILLTALVALPLALAGCGDDDDGPVNGGTSDTTPPGVASVTPVDAFHLDVTFTEDVTESSAEDEDHYIIIEAAASIRAALREHSAVPGDSLLVATAVLQPDSRTVALTTLGSMAGLNFNLSVSGVSDVHGNRINTPVEQSFTGSSDPDVTPPEIVARSPSPGAVNVPIGTAVTIEFSEPVDYTSFVSGASWTSQATPVLFQVQTDGATYAMVPFEPLDMNALQTVALTGIQDFFGNTMSDAQWSFTTTNVADNTPPTLVSTVPANNAINVDVNANLSMTFSEAVNQIDFNVQLAPDPGNGTTVWSNGGKTVTFDPDAPLLDNQQYVLTIYPHGVLDLAGNGIAGLHTVVFSTGGALENGSIAGTITGHPGSDAADPTGALVIAADDTPFMDDFFVLGSATVAGNDSYNISRLSDGIYYLICALDTNGDGNVDPGDGDAIGAYGIDFGTLDLDPDSVVVAGGSDVTGINFPIYDSSTISGTISYDGVYSEGFYPVLVGLFDATGFDPLDTPVSGAEAFWPSQRQWGFNSLDQFFPDDQYYVGAFLDVNENFTYDPAVDPAGFYGGLPTPTAINVSNGSDHRNIVIPLSDPGPALNARAVSWPAAKHNPKFQRLCDLVRRGQEMANK